MEAKADPQAPAENGKTALAEALEKGHAKAVDVLLGVEQRPDDLPEVLQGVDPEVIEEMMNTVRDLLSRRMGLRRNNEVGAGR